ncbi:MAG: hypothetical protein HY791_35885 [Deltaproteobacteria bacterium]|nr:hypothetical protein [Deltaproteobacteria bacterium]
MARRLISAALLIRHGQAIRDEVLIGPRATTGADVVFSVKELLQRLSRLETTEEGRAAFRTLAEWGIDGRERGRVADLVRVAMGY